MSAKLTIRDWQDSDMETLATMHRKMDVGYPLPESFGPLFFVRKAVVDENGEVVGMATVRLVGEAYVWLNDEISALARAKGVKMLNEACAKEASRSGLDDVSCWIPDRISKCFARVIERLGWQRSRWHSWSISLK